MIKGHYTLQLRCNNDQCEAEETFGAPSETLARSMAETDGWMLNVYQSVALCPQCSEMMLPDWPRPEWTESLKEY